MHPTDCPKKWDYDETPEKKAEVDRRCEAILVELRSGGIDFVGSAKDTRPTHLRMFQDETPPDCDYYAGQYRGADFRCLRYLRVNIGNDPLVGSPPDVVARELEVFKDVLDKGLAGQRIGHALPITQVSEVDKLLYLVDFVCLLLAEFMRIHPYANGNGHIGRYIVWSMLGLFGKWPLKWPLANRPADPPYSDCLRLYRRGQQDHLVKFVLGCIQPPTPPAPILIGLV